MTNRRKATRRICFLPAVLCPGASGGKLLRKTVCSWTAMRLTGSVMWYALQRTSESKSWKHQPPKSHDCESLGQGRSCYCSLDGLFDFIISFIYLVISSLLFYLPHGTIESIASVRDSSIPTVESSFYSPCGAIDITQFDDNYKVSPVPELYLHSRSQHC